MKAIITKLEATSNSQFNIDVTVNDDNGKPLFSGQMGFNAVFADTSQAIAYIKDAIKNRTNQAVAENGSVSKPEVEKLIGQEFDI